ncbi:MAG: cation diffusion facilitator family transporter, partial [Symploca sp. SIO2B6]|nr:cation diffusion facilitator family transporter [Symploca sp. SIO2B6]
MADTTHHAMADRTLSDTDRRHRSTYRVLLISLWVTLMVLVIKLWLGWITQSLSILAESLHTLLDSLSTLLSLLSLSSSDRLGWHNVWSHGKRDVISVLLLVAFLGFASFSLLIMAAQSLETLDDIGLALTKQSMNMFAIVTVVTLCLAVFKRHRSHVMTSSLLRLNAQHTLRDVWLTVLVFLGLAGVKLGYGWLDPVITILLVLMLAGSAWQLINWQLPFMVQQVAIAPEVLTQMAKQIEGVSHCYRVQSRGLVGRQVFVELYLGVHPEFMGVARTIAQRLEAMIRTRYGPVKV